MSIVATRTRDANTTIFDLKTVTDERATLTATRKVRMATGLSTDASGAEGPIAIELAATVGLFGDRTAERKLTRAVQSRLEQLEGVDFRAIRK